MNKFLIHSNDFLYQHICSYYSLHYFRLGVPGNPDFLNKLKNTFDSECISILQVAKHEVLKWMSYSIPKIMELHDLQTCVCIGVPRAKALDTYTPNQLFFKDAIRDAVSKISGAIDGTDAIIRHTNTKTTHLPKTTGRITNRGKEHNNDGDMPYRGITKDTCKINEDITYNRDIILIDDIYTWGVNIDEDCIQAILNTGARSVIFYAIAKAGG